MFQASLTVLSFILLTSLMRSGSFYTSQSDELSLLGCELNLIKMGRDRYAKQSLGALYGRIKQVRLTFTDDERHWLRLLVGPCPYGRGWWYRLRTTEESCSYGLWWNTYCRSGHHRFEQSQSPVPFPSWAHQEIESFGKPRWGIGLIHKLTPLFIGCERDCGKIQPSHQNRSIPCKY